MEGLEADAAEGEVVVGVPLEVFAEGLQARHCARQLVASSLQPTEATCVEARSLCQNAFRTMRDAYLADCREQTRRCNRLRDLLGECQDLCEAAGQRCRARPQPAMLWGRLAGSR
mmetsp:Transcript_38375/g.114643  ORF Transcript_38375/g.114643 Transcript_38375/m.114643 type:complete len:115 (-) Transcript_38375:132-476(-)